MSQVADKMRNGEEDDDCDCACHHGGHHEFRLMQGSSIEGISIRDVVVDKKGKIKGWSYPISTPTASVEEVKEDLDFTIKELEELREAFDKPVLDELALEAEIEIAE